MSKINFKAESDRSLLELTAQAVNDINEEKLPAMVRELKDLNGTVRQHETRIVKMETKQKMIHPGNNPGSNPGVQSRLLDMLANIGGGWVAAILTIAALVTIIYHVGRVFMWWG